MWTTPLMLKKTMSIVFIFNLLVLAFLGPGDSEVCNSKIWSFISESYYNAHVSLLVMTLSKKLSLFCTRSKRSLAIGTRSILWWSINNMKTNLYTFCIFKLSLMMSCIVVIEILRVSAVIRTFIWRLIFKRTRIWDTFSSVLLVDVPLFLGHF